MMNAVIIDDEHLAREELISKLTPREEGFTDGQKLIFGKPYPGVRRIPKDNTNPAERHYRARSELLISCPRSERCCDYV